MVLLGWSRRQTILYNMSDIRLLITVLDKIVKAHGTSVPSVTLHSRFMMHLYSLAFDPSHEMDDHNSAANPGKGLINRRSCIPSFKEASSCRLASPPPRSTAPSTLRPYTAFIIAAWTLNNTVVTTVIIAVFALSTWAHAADCPLMTTALAPAILTDRLYGTGAVARAALSDHSRHIWR
jgi:hypothetical protein